MEGSGRGTIVFVHAHPDDEALLTAGTMARAAAEGLRVVLVVATDGAAGLTSQAMSDRLTLRRAAELAASADALGVSDVISLGRRDSGLHGEVADGFAHDDVDDVASRLGRIFEDVNADIVVGYDAAGGYGHPDHLAVHRAVRRAVSASTRSLRLFEATLPREPIVAAVRSAARLHLTPRNFDSATFDGSWTPRAAITHRVDVRAHMPAKLASLRAHASQATADGQIRTLAVLTRMPGPLRTTLLGTEYYVAVPAALTAATQRSTASGAS